MTKMAHQDPDIFNLFLTLVFQRLHIKYVWGNSSHKHNNKYFKIIVK